MNEKIPQFPKPPNPIEQKAERIPTPEEVHEVIKQMVPGEYQETKRLLNDQGQLFRLDVLAQGSEEGETIDLCYMRKGVYPSGDSSTETEVHSVLMKNGEYNGAGPQASWVDGKWVVIE